MVSAMFQCFMVDALNPNNRIATIKLPRIPASGERISLIHLHGIPAAELSQPKRGVQFNRRTFIVNWVEFEVIDGITVAGDTSVAVRPPPIDLDTRVLLHCSPE